jgi:hypothetical protein
MRAINFETTEEEDRQAIETIWPGGISLQDAYDTMTAYKDHPIGEYKEGDANVITTREQHFAAVTALAEQVRLRREARPKP